MTPDTTTAMAAPSRVDARPAPAPVRPHAAHVPARIGQLPRWFRVLDGIHRAARSPIAISVDSLVIVTAGIAVGVHPGVAAALAAGFVATLYLSGKYADRTSLETQGFMWYASQIVVAIAIATLVGVGVAYKAGLDVGLTLRFGVVAGAGLVAVRFLTWSVIAPARRRGIGLRRTLIVGHSAPARMLVERLTGYPEAGLVPVAMLPMANGHGFARFMPEFPNAHQLATVITEGAVEHVVLAPDGSDEAILECVKGSQGLDVQFSILPPMSELFINPGHVAQVAGLPLIPLGQITKSTTVQPGKRLLDLVAASLLLVLLSPLMLATAIAIKLLDRGAILYRQRRVGRGGVEFQLLKFRSMVEGAERVVIDLRDLNASDGLLFKIVDDPRVTRVGRVIRRFSIDELPQLWNVVRGEMSLVGPRPLAVRPSDFGAIDGRRHVVTPGITGYWQISGGNGLTYEEMIKLDLAYIQNWSLWLDIRLLLRTLPALLHRRGPW